MKALLEQLAPLAGEALPRAAGEAMRLMGENAERRNRAETAERDFLLVGAALIRDEFPEHYEDG